MRARERLFPWFGGVGGEGKKKKTVSVFTGHKVK